MSFFPSPYLGRLQDLKLWQGNYDSLLQNKSTETVNPSDFETIETLSALDSSRSSPLELNKGKNIDWDKKTITPTKPFEQLLEEKLAEDKPIHIQVKPKKPFLKKGTGLTRYNIIYRPSSGKSSKKCSFQKSVSSEKNGRRQCVKTSVDINTDILIESHKDVTPLKMPEVAMKPKATWCHVLENNDNKFGEENNKIKETPVKDKHLLNCNIIGKINEFALRHFLPKSPRKNANLQNIDNSVVINKIDNKSVDFADFEQNNDVSSTKSYFENTAEKELRIFETLEERAEHSSFSSTNSSILQLLSSTPHKPKINMIKSPIMEEIGEPQEQISVLTNFNHREHLAQKLQEVDKKQDVLHNFLNNLRKIVDNQEDGNTGSVKVSNKHTSDTTFSEQDNWSTNTDTRSQSPSSFYTDFENTFKSNIVSKVEVAVNTSFPETDDKIQNINECSNCEDLRKNLEKLLKEVPDIQAEKAKVCDFAKDLEKKRDQLNKEIQKLNKKYEEDVADLREELEAEKRNL